MCDLTKRREKRDNETDKCVLFYKVGSLACLLACLLLVQATAACFSP
jgi:hypothetical protein